VIDADAAPQDILCDEILADARRQSERALQRARAEAKAILAKAAADVEQERQSKLATAKAEAQRRRNRILATVPVEIARLRAERSERELRSVYSDALAQLHDREGFDIHETYAGLIVRALQAMPGDRFVLEIAEADLRLLGDDLLVLIRERLNRPEIEVAIESAVDDGTLIIRDPDGRRIWDNSPTARLQRMWPALRSEIALRTGIASGQEPTPTP